jgi:transcriptional regulator with AAA-type ATPase domain
MPDTSIPLYPEPAKVPADPYEYLEYENWLAFHRVWGKMSDDTINAIARHLQVLPIPANTPIYQENQTPQGIYFLKWGTVEIYRQSPVGKSHITYRNAGEVFGYLPLVSNQWQHKYQANAIALTSSEVWFLHRDTLQTLTQKYPDLQQAITSLLVQDLERFTERIASEQARIQGLQPYLQPLPNQEGIVGSSKPSQKLAKSVETASQDQKPIVFQAQRGTGKTFIAGLIHQQSSLQNQPFAEIDCATLVREAGGTINSDRIFGSGEHTIGILELVERGTLAIDNVHLLSKSDRERLFEYLKTGTIYRNHATTPRQISVRLILIAPQKLNLPDIDHHTIKLPPLTQRKADIGEFARHFVRKFCQESDRPFLELDQADLRRLISYNYPGNIAELAAILERAVAMTPSGQTVIPEQVLWSVESQKNSFRIDLLNFIPGLRKFLLSDWWPQRTWILMMLVFVPVTLMGFIGPQGRDESITLHLFWAWWWPFYLLLFPILGRLWCSVCPFMITAEWLRNLSLWIFPRSLKPWNTKALNRWGAWWLWAGFVAIYIWEKLWDLPHSAYLSAWLLMIITGGAIIFSLIYERRLWCRYLCPIGGMNGLFAKLSVVELRSTQQVCGSQCSTFGCYKGSDATPVNFPDPLPTEGQATGGCPLYSHPAQLKDNRDCMFCMTCLKACPNRSVQLNLRFPAADILENHQPFWAEVALLVLLLGGVFMHQGNKFLSWFGWGDIPLDSEHLLVSLPVVSLLLSIPFVLTYGIHQLTRLWMRLVFPSGQQTFPEYLQVIYAYLPLTLGANLAYYIPTAITESGTLLPTLARTAGFSGGMLPTLTWSLDVANFLQGVVLLWSFGFSVYLLSGITKRFVKANLPHILLMLGLTVVFFPLMVF